MRAIDIYNFRRTLNNSNFHNIETPSNIISELIDLKNSIDYIVQTWTQLNLYKIKNEKNKTLQS
jgi:hypothetical protein